VSPGLAAGSFVDDHPVAIGHALEPLRKVPSMADARVLVSRPVVG